MSTLSTGRRKALPTAKFGLPATKKYPMPDRRHAANAKARASQELENGKLSTSAKKRIDAKANKILDRDH